MTILTQRCWQPSLFWFLAVACFTACASGASNTVESRQFDLPSFARIAFRGAGTASLLVGDTPTATITSNQDAFNAISLEVEGDTLIVDTSSVRSDIDTLDLAIRTTQPLQGISALNSLSLSILSPLADVAHIGMGQNAAISMQSRCESLHLLAIESAIMDARRAQCRSVELNASGNAQVVINAAEEATLRLGGSSRTTLYGQPTIDLQRAGENTLFENVTQ